MIEDAHPPVSAVRDLVARALAEDLAPIGDMTSSLIDKNTTATAAFVARDAGVVAGRLCADEAFDQVAATLERQWSLDDGEPVERGGEIGRVSGSLRSILTAERTALNLMCHLSGVATLTRRFVEAAAPLRVLDTRKTTPGLRILEKAAVRAGGGFNHRGSLSDGVLLKDNHLQGQGVRINELVAQARRRWPGRMIEVECERLAQVVEAVDAGATMVLLDNMEPDDVRTAVEVVAERCMVEVSGGVSLENVHLYARTGADFVSVGRLTHSAPILDIGLDLCS